MFERRKTSGRGIATRVLLTATVAMCCAATASAQWQFDQVITEDEIISAIPSFTGQIPLPVYIDGDRVVINGFATSGDTAISHGTLGTLPGTLSTLVNTTLNPTTGNPFVATFSPSLSSGRFAFYGLSRPSPTAPLEYGIFYQDAPGGPLLAATNNYGGATPRHGSLTTATTSRTKTPTGSTCSRPATYPRWRSARRPRCPASPARYSRLRPSDSSGRAGR